MDILIQRLFMPEYSAAAGLTPTKNTFRPYLLRWSSRYAAVSSSKKRIICKGIRSNTFVLVSALKLSGKPLMPLYASVLDRLDTSRARPVYRKLPPKVTTMAWTPQ